MSSSGAIRPIAAAVIRGGDRILVWDDHDPTTGEVVAVPLAGGIELGETGAGAIARELGEEIGATPTRIDYLGEARPWHEAQDADVETRTGGKRYVGRRAAN